MFSACIDFGPLPPRRGVRLWLVALFHKVFAVTGANPANIFTIEWSIGGGWSTMSALGWWRPYRFCLISRLPSFRLVVVLEERHSCRVFSLMAEGRTLNFSVHFVFSYFQWIHLPGVIWMYFLLSSFFDGAWFFIGQLSRKLCSSLDQMPWWGVA